MAAVPDQPRSPVIANIVVIVGFVAVFSTFATNSAFSWIIGAGMIVAGGIWAGFAGDRRDDEGRDDGGAN